ncbi:MAG: DUF58 domain-containing protein [Butyrivibrio sp.]|nr:DUF58 domain-containing protein [Acetatifactor muris]MCM1558411.1 DUF58 domain-containing protein [Butyrivibrio sp.]
MTRRIILYILILASCCWLVMLYTFQGLRFLLALLLCVPLLCLLSLLPQKRRVEVEIGGMPDYVTRGECIRLRVTVTHKGRLPLAGLKIRGTWRAHGEKPLKVENMTRGLSGRTRREIEFELPAEHCGAAEFTVEKVKIYDCLRLFSVSVSGKQVRRLLVTPKLLPVPDSEAGLILNLLRTHSEEEDGDFFVREYRPGDSPRSIHWKLTAKEDELQVKDFEPDRQVSLFLNRTEGLKNDSAQKDRFLDRACSLMAFLAEVCGDRAVVCWMQDGVLQRNRIQEPGDIYPCIRKLIFVEKTGVAEPQSPAVQCMLTGCHLEEDGRLYFGEQCVDDE